MSTNTANTDTLTNLTALSKALRALAAASFYHRTTPRAELLRAAATVRIALDKAVPPEATTRQATLAVMPAFIALKLSSTECSELGSALKKHGGALGAALAGLAPLADERCDAPQVVEPAPAERHWLPVSRSVAHHDGPSCWYSHHVCRLPKGDTKAREAVYCLPRSAIYSRDGGESSQCAWTARHWGIEHSEELRWRCLAWATTLQEQVESALRQLLLKQGRELLLVD